MKSDVLMFQILILSLILNIAGIENDSYAGQSCVNEQEYRLYELINDYRAEHGLPAVPLSPSLCFVAGAHVWDLNTNQPEGGRCNMHSWSDEGPWTKCCYTTDHKRASCIWSKPSELTDYEGYGYEVAYYSSWTVDRHNDMAWAALEGWKSSPGHDQMIRNMYSWRRMNWKAMGVGIYGNYVVVWFGEKKDEVRKVKRCF